MNRIPIDKYIFGLFILFGTMGCEEQTNWDFKPEDNGTLAVEAIVTNEFKTHEIRLSLTFDELNGQPVPVSGAQVIGDNGQDSLSFFEDPNEAGKYLSEQPFAAQLNQIYHLEIQWNGQSYHAENEMVPVYPFNKMTFNSYGQTDSFTIAEVAPFYSPNEQAMYEINIDWSHLTNSDSSHAKLFFYTFNTIDASELFRPEKETIVFPKGSVVIEKKHSLNDDFAAFYRALAMETDWQGGVYDENSSSLPTNLSNGAVGFFGVSAVLMDTLIAE